MTDEGSACRSIRVVQQSRGNARDRNRSRYKQPGTQARVICRGALKFGPVSQAKIPISCSPVERNAYEQSSRLKVISSLDPRILSAESTSAQGRKRQRLVEDRRATLGRFESVETTGWRKIWTGRENNSGTGCEGGKTRDEGGQKMPVGRWK